MQMKFDDWKKEYSPEIQIDNSECEEHDNGCECEFLYSFELTEILNDEELTEALYANKVWTWRENGEIVSGIESAKASLLVTEKPYTQQITVK